LAIRDFDPEFLPNNLGYTFFFAGLLIYQLADFIGFSGLSLVVYLLNTGFACACMSSSGRFLIRWLHLAVCAFVFLILNALGYFHGKNYEDPVSNSEKVSILMIQPWEQLNSMESIKPTAVIKLIDDLSSFTRAELDGHILTPDLIVWPELTYPLEVNARTDHVPRFDATAALIRKYKTPLLMGTHISVFEEFLDFQENGGGSYNAAALFDRSANLQSIYKKEVLFPFVESYPLPSFISSMFPDKRLVPGRNDQLVEEGPMRLGIAICYEGIFSSHFRSQALEGANMFISLSNDSWFMNTLGAKQHYLMTMARAIEYRLPLVRVGQSGISAAILPDGTFLTESPQSRSWAERVTIPLTSDPQLTFYARFPHLVLILVASGMLSLIIWRGFDKEKP